MIVNVHMLAFHDDIIRCVDVPDIEVIGNSNGLIGFLALAYHYGQNDFIQGQDADTIRRSISSVSVGDVIELPGHGNHMVTLFGFKQLTDEEYTRYKSLPTHSDRSCYAYKQFSDIIVTGKLA